MAIDYKTKYTGIALRKIAILVKRQDFRQIIGITPERVHIRLEDDECKISTLGKVTWSASKDFKEL